MALSRIVSRCGLAQTVMMKVSKTIGQRSLPSDYHIILGEILVEWAWIEFRFQEAIWHLLSIPRKEGRTLTSEMQVGGLVDALSILAMRKIKEVKIAKEVGAIAKRIRKKIPKRNLLVHGAWDYDSKTGIATVRKYRGTPVSGKAQSWNRPALSTFLSELKADRVRLQHLLDQV